MLAVKYFAYGSNLDIERLIKRVGYVTSYKPFILKDYKLAFNTGYGKRRTGVCFANIIASPGSSVEGMLYNMSERQFAELDRFEGLYTRKYFYIDQNTLGCVYVGDPMFETTNKADKSYVYTIMYGAKQHNLQKTFAEAKSYLTRKYPDIKLLSTT